MTINNRRVIPNVVGQGKNEAIAYKIDFTRWCLDNGNPPVSADVELIRLDTDADVTGINCTGSPSISGFVITTPSVHDLIPNVQYRMNIQASVDGNTLESWMVIVGEE